MHKINKKYRKKVTCTVWNACIQVAIPIGLGDDHDGASIRKYYTKKQELNLKRDIFCTGKNMKLQWNFHGTRIFFWGLLHAQLRSLCCAGKNAAFNQGIIIFGRIYNCNGIKKKRQKERNECRFNVVLRPPLTTVNYIIVHSESVKHSCGDRQFQNPTYSAEEDRDEGTQRNSISENYILFSLLWKK